MCKVLMMTGVKNAKAAQEFMIASLEFMTRTEKDGVGYAAMDNQGKLFGERWLHPSDALNGDPTTDKDKKMIANMADILYTGQHSNIYSKHGELNMDNASTILMHTRFATCTKGFNNTHPFFIEDSAMIHNGMIRNADLSKTLENKISSCDSEVVLNKYLELNINKNPSIVQDMMDELKGYWAFGFLSYDSDGTPIFDAVRTETAGSSGNLFCTYIDQIGAVVYCSTRQILQDTLELLNWEHNNAIFSTKKNVLVRHNALTGDVIKYIKHDDSALNSYTQYGGGTGNSGSGNTTGNGNVKKKSTGAQSHTRNNSVGTKNNGANTGNNANSSVKQELPQSHISGFLEASDSKYYDHRDEGNTQELLPEWIQDDYKELQEFYEELTDSSKEQLDDLPYEMKYDCLYWMYYEVERPVNN